MKAATEELNLSINQVEILSCFFHATLVFDTNHTHTQRQVIFHRRHFHSYITLSKSHWESKGLACVESIAIMKFMFNILGQHDNL